MTNLPSGWTEVALGDAFSSVQSGKNVKQNKTGAGTPVTRIETISSGVVDSARVGWTEEHVAASDRSWMKPGDLLFSHINSPDRVGQVALYESSPPQLLHGINLLRLRPDPNVLDSRFALHLFRTPTFRMKVRQFVNQAVNQASISATNLKGISISIPALKEQRRIAAILDKADELRAKRRAAFEQLDSLTQAIFLDMFGHPLDESTDAREPIARLGRVTTGRTPPSSKAGMFGGPVPFVTPGDLESGRSPVRTLTNAGAAASRVVRPGATLVCCIGAIGKVGRADVPSAFNQQINAVEWNDRVTDEYGYAVMKAIKPLIKSRGASTTLPLLNKSDFQALEIPLPPVERQRLFGKRIRACRELASDQRRAAESAELLYGSIAARAFRGEL